MNWKIPVLIITIFIGGFWGGWALRTVQIGLFGYTPCWSTLSDVYDEQQYQDTKGRWNFRTPDIGNDCELINKNRRWNGWKKS